MQNDTIKAQFSDYGNIVFYRTDSGHNSLDVHLTDDTVWLNQRRLAETGFVPQECLAKW